MGKKRAKSRHRENEQAKRDVRQLSALEYRARGWTYERIAKELGVSINTAYLDTNKALEEVREQAKEAAQEVMEIELRRLDDWLRALDLRIQLGQPTAIQAALKIQERRAKLLGLDAPTPTNVEPVPDTIEVIDPYEGDDQA